MTTFINRPVGSAGLGFPNDNVTPIIATVDGVANTAIVSSTVPAGKFWLINNVNVAQTDATARAVAIQVTDGANLIATIAGDLVTTGATGTVTRFNGQVLLPSGYVLRGNVVAVSASTPVLQFSGFEASNGLSTPSFPIN